MSKLEIFHNKIRMLSVREHFKKRFLECNVLKFYRRPSILGNVVAFEIRWNWRSRLKLDPIVRAWHFHRFTWPSFGLTNEWKTFSQIMLLSPQKVASLLKLDGYFVFAQLLPLKDFVSSQCWINFAINLRQKCLIVQKWTIPTSFFFIFIFSMQLIVPIWVKLSFADD